MKFNIEKEGDTCPNCNKGTIEHQKDFECPHDGEIADVLRCNVCFYSEAVDQSFIFKFAAESLMGADEIASQWNKVKSKGILT